MTLTLDGYQFMFCLIVLLLVLPGWCFGMPALAGYLSRRGWL